MFKFIYQLRWLIFPLALIFSGWLLFSLVDVEQLQSKKIKWNWIAAALILNLFYIFLYSQIWHSVTRLYGVSIPRKFATAVYIFSNLGKYLPLKIVGITYRIAIYAERFNRAPYLVVRSCYIETIASLLAGIISALILFPFNSELSNTINWYWYPLIGALLFFILLEGPQRIIFSTAFRILKKQIPDMTNVHGGYTILIIKYLVAWFVFGASLYFLCLGIGIQLSMSGYVTITGIYIIAGVAGILVFVIPSGIGVREGVLLVGLGTMMSASDAALITILARVSITFAEMLGALIAFTYLETSSLLRELDHKTIPTKSDI